MVEIGCIWFGYGLHLVWIWFAWFATESETCAKKNKRMRKTEEGGARGTEREGRGRMEETLIISSLRKGVI